jgi:transcriptional regulator with XRE-family HTH domain
MSDIYDDKESAVVALLVSRLFNKAQKMGFSYRQLAAVTKAKSHVTIWRWAKKKNLPSRHHVYHIKAFLGYIK